MRVSFSTVAEIAATQHGRITAAQLRECGFGKVSTGNAVERWLLHREHVGVYMVGHRALTREGRWHGAVLACGPSARLTCGDAAFAYDFHDRLGPRVHVTVPPGSHRRRPGIAIHRSPVLAFEETTWGGIPITTPSRAMVDLAHELGNEERITWALRQLEFARLYDQRMLELSNHRRPNAVLTRLLAGVEPTLSPLEIAFLHRVVRRHQLPAPEVNEKVCGFLVDFFWPQARLIVETDGGHHKLPLQRAADEHRDAIHTAAGFLVLRFDWADVHHRDEATAAAIRAALLNRTLTQGLVQHG